MTEQKTAFISYSWDDTSHQDWVRALAERLVGNGVHVYLDQWDVQPGDSLTRFMNENLPTSDFALVVCTPNYAIKSGKGQGGVGYEAQIITAFIAAGMTRSKFVPIIRKGSMTLGDAECAIPPHFFGIFALDMRDEQMFDRSFENLIRHIYGKPFLQRPPLGEPPAFLDPFPSAVLARLDMPTARLAHHEIEHWELISGVVRNELHPETFIIPDDASRRSIARGDYVKLGFEYSYPEDIPDDVFGGGERMWVEVTGIDGPYYVGKLANNPVCTAEWHDLKFDSPIVFLPEHVISLDKNGDELKEHRQNETDLKSEIQKFIDTNNVQDVNTENVISVLRYIENSGELVDDNEDTTRREHIAELLGVSETEIDFAYFVQSAILAQGDEQDE